MIDPHSIQKAKDADLLALIGSSTRLKRMSASEGGEYAGPCPMCGGKDRFYVQPARGRWLCRYCTGKWSDAIALHRALNHSSFEEAVRNLCGGEADGQTQPKIMVEIRELAANLPLAGRRELLAFASFLQQKYLPKKGPDKEDA